MKAIYTKLWEVQNEIKAIEKTEDNPFFHSKYFSVDSVIAQLKPILTRKKLVVIQPLAGDQGTPTLNTVVCDVESGEWINFATPLPQNPDPQKQGAIITYFRRYALVSLFLLQGELDDDANSAAPTKAVSHKKSVADTLLKLEPEKRTNAINNLEKTGEWTAAELNALRTRPKV